MSKWADQDSEPQMRPTMHLRWSNTGRYWCSWAYAVDTCDGQVDTYFVLEQLWVDGQGNQEWREVEVQK